MNTPKLFNFNGEPAEQYRKLVSQPPRSHSHELIRLTIPAFPMRKQTNKHQIYNKYILIRVRIFTTYNVKYED